MGNYIVAVETSSGCADKRYWKTYYNISSAEEAENKFRTEFPNLVIQIIVVAEIIKN